MSLIDFQSSEKIWSVRKWWNRNVTFLWFAFKRHLYFTPHFESTTEHFNLHPTFCDPIPAMMFQGTTHHFQGCTPSFMIPHLVPKPQERFGPSCKDLRFHPTFYDLTPCFGYQVLSKPTFCNPAPWSEALSTFQGSNVLPLFHSFKSTTSATLWQTVSTYIKSKNCFE